MAEFMHTAEKPVFNPKAKRCSAAPALQPENTHPPALMPGQPLPDHDGLRNATRLFPFLPHVGRLQPQLFPTQSGGTLGPILATPLQPTAGL